MIITVSLFGSLFHPHFLYRHTKSMLMPGFVTYAKQKPKHDNKYSLLPQMHNFIRISTWIWSHPGWRVTSVHRCVLQTPWIFTSATTWWFQKKDWFSGLSFSASASCFRKIRRWPEIVMPSICKQCGLQFPIRQSTPCNQKERKNTRAIADISPDQKWQRVEITYKSMVQYTPLQFRSLKLTSVCLFSWYTPLCYLCKRPNGDSTDTEAVTATMTSLQTFQAAN